MRYDNFPKRDYRRHYIDTRQKARTAVFRQSGNNRGAVLENAVTGAFTFSDERAKRRKLEKQNGGQVRPLSEMARFSCNKYTIPRCNFSEGDVVACICSYEDEDFSFFSRTAEATPLRIRTRRAVGILSIYEADIL